MKIWVKIIFSIHQGSRATSIFTISKIEQSLYNQLSEYFEENEIDSSICRILPDGNDDNGYKSPKFKELTIVPTQEIEILQKHLSFKHIYNSIDNNNPFYDLFTLSEYYILFDKSLQILKSIKESNPKDYILQKLIEYYIAYIDRNISCDSEDIHLSVNIYQSVCRWQLSLDCNNILLQHLPIDEMSETFDINAFMLVDEYLEYNRYFAVNNTIRPLLYNNSHLNDVYLFFCEDNIIFTIHDLWEYNLQKIQSFQDPALDQVIKYMTTKNVDHVYIF